MLQYRRLLLVFGLLVLLCLASAEPSVRLKDGVMVVEAANDVVLSAPGNNINVNASSLMAALAEVITLRHDMSVLQGQVVQDKQDAAAAMQDLAAENEELRQELSTIRDKLTTLAQQVQLRHVAALTTPTTSTGHLRLALGRLAADSVASLSIHLTGCGHPTASVINVDIVPSLTAAAGVEATVRTASVVEESEGSIRFSDYVHFKAKPVAVSGC